MNIKEAVEFARNKVQEYTDKIQNTLNPICYGDLPFLYVSLKTFTETIEANMDAEQKEVAEALSRRVGAVRTVTTMPKEAYEKMKNSEGGGQ